MTQAIEVTKANYYKLPSKYAPPTQGRHSPHPPPSGDQDGMGARVLEAVAAARMARQASQMDEGGAKRRNG